jgi:hypothetical protein
MGPLSQVTNRSQFETMTAKSLGEGSKINGILGFKASLNNPIKPFSSGPKNVTTFTPSQ